MKKLILTTGTFAYLFLMLACMDARAQQAATAEGPLIHVHIIKDFKGKTTVKDTTFRMDSTKMHAMMMHKRMHRFRNDSVMRKHFGTFNDSEMTAHREMMRHNHEGMGQKWAMHGRGILKNADSVSVLMKITVRGDSIIRDVRRITYFKPSLTGNNNKTADTLIRLNVTVHRGVKPNDIPDFKEPGMMNEDMNPGDNQQFPNEGTLQLNDLNIYPNPSNGQFRISFSASENAPVNLKITDMDGKTVWQDANPDFNGQYDKNIDLSGQPKAVYILEIMQDNKTMLKKLVIN